MGKEAKYVVRLTEEECQSLQALLSEKRVAADGAFRSRILLKADLDGDAWSDAEIADAFDVGLSTIHRLRQRLIEDGLKAALSRRPMSQKRAPKLDGAKEARLIASACGPAPDPAELISEAHPGVVGAVLEQGREVLASEVENNATRRMTFLSQSVRT